MSRWSLKQHRDKSPQFNISIRHERILWILGIIISFFLGLASQIWIFPKIFEHKPNVSITVHNEEDLYLTKIQNIPDNSLKFQIKTDRKISDLRAEIFLPGVLTNIEENGRNSECEYKLQKQHNLLEGFEKEYIGNEILNVHCKNIGNDGSYRVRFDLDTSKYEPVMLSDRANPNKSWEISKFTKVWCYYYFEGYNEIKKENCNIDFKIDN